MSPPLVQLLRELIELDLEWRSIQPSPPPDLRGLEVSPLGVNRRTAEALCAVGLAEMVTAEGSRHPTIFLLSADSAIKTDHLRMFRS